MDFASLFTPDNILDVVLFVAKPLVLLLICKIVIGTVLKMVNQIFNKSNLDKGIQTFGKSAIRIVCWALAIIIIAGSIGVDTASLVAVLGVASLALSLAVQGIFTNVFSGITILMTKPFVVGDYVDVAGVSGTVKAIDLMRTTLTTVDNKVELVPNGDIAASRITNYSTEPLRRVDLKVSASYNAETADVISAIRSVIDSDARIKTDEAHAPFIRLSAFNANDIEYTIRVWVDNGDYWGVYFDTLENIRESFKTNHIEFSYPHMVVHGMYK